MFHLDHFFGDFMRNQMNIYSKSSDHQSSVNVMTVLSLVTVG